MANLAPLDAVLDDARAGRTLNLSPLIAAGIDINTEHPTFKEPLIMICAGMDNLPAVQQVLKEGGDKNWAVRGAAKNNRVELLQWLIKLGGDIDLAVYYAAHFRQIALVRSLLSQGASIHNAIRGAAHTNDQVFVNELLNKGGSIDQAVVGAAEHHHTELVKTLLKLGGKIEQAVLGAGLGNHLDLIQRYVQDGADLNRAVYGAARSHHESLVMTLIEQGADRNAALNGAILYKHFSLAKKLMAQGADSQACIISIARIGDKNWIDTLLTQGGNLHFAAQGAAQGGQTELLYSLLERGASLDSAIYGAARGQQTTLVHKLIRTKKASVDYALMGALKDKDFKLVHDLLSQYKVDLYTFATFEGFKKQLSSLENTATFLASFPRAQQKQIAIIIDKRHMCPNIPMQPLLPIMAIMNQRQIAYRLAKAWHEHPQLLTWLTQKPAIHGMSNDMVLTIASQTAGLTHYETLKLQQAMLKSLEPAWFNRIADRLSQRHFRGKSKAAEIRSASTVTERTQALAKHRIPIIFKHAFLTSGLQSTMQRYAEFQNLTALKTWIKNLIQYSKQHIFSSTHRALAKKLEAALKNLANDARFTNETHDPETLKQFLQTGSTTGLLAALQRTPYFQDLQKQFPELAKSFDAATATSQLRA